MKSWKCWPCGLHQMGAAQAEVVAFRCGRGPVDLGSACVGESSVLGLTDKQVCLGLDWCHAVHHVEAGLGAGADRRRAQTGVQETAQMAQGRPLAEGRG